MVSKCSYSLMTVGIFHFSVSAFGCGKANYSYSKTIIIAYPVKPPVYDNSHMSKMQAKRNRALYWFDALWLNLCNADLKENVVSNVENVLLIVTGWFLLPRISKWLSMLQNFLTGVVNHISRLLNHYDAKVQTKVSTLFTFGSDLIKLYIVCVSIHEN